MDSVPLEMDDIFGDYEEAEDFNPARLPDLEDELEPMRDLREDDDNDAGDNEDEGGTVNAELLAKLKSMKGASKHTTKNTMPKLDAVRLTGDRGIPVLPKIFEDVHLKGKNHEAEDLKNIMQHFEHWAHRLFPKMPFAEVLERAERLGAKKEVQTCVKKIRLDLPVLTSDQVEYEDELVVRRGSDGEREDDSSKQVEQNSRLDEIDEDELEDLLREQAEPLATLTNHMTSSDTSSQPPGQSSQPPGQSSQPTGQSKISSSISDEMKERIERNRKLAMERRAARTGQICQEIQEKTVFDGETTSAAYALASDGKCQETPEDTERSPLFDSDAGAGSDVNVTDSNSHHTKAGEEDYLMEEEAMEDEPS